MSRPPSAIGVRAAYALPGAATKALVLPLISFLPPLYAQQPSLSLAAVGLLFMAARFWDILIDPAVGYVMDRSNPPLGRRKFWILVAAPLMLLTVWPLFDPAPGLGVAGLGGLLFLFYLGWTIVQISHAAWPAELTRDPAERVRLIGWREWAGVIGMIAILSAPALIGKTSSLTDQARILGVVVMVLLPLTLLPALVFLPRRAYQPAHKPSPIDLWVLLSAPGPLRRLLTADLLSGAAYAANSATAFFIVSDHLRLGAQYPMIMLCFMLGMLAGIPVLMRVSQRRGERFGFGLSMIGAALASLVFAAVPPGSAVLAMAAYAAIGFFTGGYQFNLSAAMVDLADQDRIRSGRDRVSLHLALLAMTNKVGYAVAIGVVYALLQVFDYRAGAADGRTTGVIIGLGLVAPAVLFIASAFNYARAGSDHHARSLSSAVK
ncbi:putative symporter YagG [Brevundimonas sp. SH203]|uniref:MFS transporter n=1 Tax=Brevundimonas sp. SH203 TaxID=345167 RepID=UPI0009CF461F|nr:MFS transporter [Brevundimonas sp. SH203]GAW40611.1 putative symporter YagG [Brevundimonas sp. SH203]